MFSVHNYAKNMTQGVKTLWAHSLSSHGYKLKKNKYIVEFVVKPSFVSSWTHAMFPFPIKKIPWIIVTTECLKISRELHVPPRTGYMVIFHPSFQMSFIDHHKQRHATPCSSLEKQTIGSKEADDKEQGSRCSGGQP